MWFKEVAADIEINRIDSTVQSLVDYNEEMEALTVVGSIPLNATASELVSSGLISYSADSSYNNVPFENLQSFFGVPAKGAGRFARDPHASIYRDVADSDSFTRIVVWFPDNHVPFNDCVTIIGKKFGKYDLIIRDFKKDETNRIAYWLSENISVEVEEDGSDVIVSIFSGKGIPGSLYSFY